MKKLTTVIFLLFSAIAYSQTQRVGINIAEPLEMLDVNGNLNLRGLIKMNGNAGINKQVLMSQGPGTDPIWTNTAYSGGGRFWTTIATNSRTAAAFSGRGDNWVVSGASTQEDSVDFGVATVSGSDISVTNGGLVNNYITINKTGLYHFEGTIRLFVSASDGVYMTPRANVRMRANRPSGVDVDIYLVEDLFERTLNQPVVPDFINFNYLAKFRIDIHLEDNTTVAFTAGFGLLRLTPALAAIGYSSGGYISGHFISE